MAEPSEAVAGGEVEKSGDEGGDADRDIDNVEHEALLKGGAGVRNTPVRVEGSGKTPAHAVGSPLCVQR